MIATDCEESAEAAARHFEHTPGIYFRFNVDQGLQDVGLEQWDKLVEVRAHTGQYIRKADVNPRLRAAGGIHLWKPGCHSTGHISTGSPNVDNAVSDLLREGGRVPFPQAGSKTRKAALLRPAVFTGRQDILTKMREYFSIIWGSNTFLSCMDSAVAGRAKLRSIC